MVRFGVAGVALLALVSATRAQGQKTTWDKVYTAEQAARGEKLYADNCASCHGETLGGVEMAPPLAGDVFNSSWEGVALADLFERMRISMPQNKPGSLSRTQNADILAHMLKVGNFPAGDVALDGQPSALAQIKFVTYEPQ
jgi:S-disulfanyl-L-cysteine oxidoreductase SoxD